MTQSLQEHRPVGRFDVGSTIRTPGVWPLTLTAAAIAIYGCVPETTHMPAFGLMTIGLAVVEVVTRQRSAPVVFVVAAASVLWSGLYGATGRDSAIVGALFALWPVVIVPTVALLVPGLRFRCELVSWVIAAIGAAAAVAVARTGAIQPTVGPALVAVAVAAPSSLVAAVAVARWPWRTAVGHGVGVGDGGHSPSGK
jgi:hypothetical protein